MCKKNGFTPYQKRVIKFLDQYLGLETPYTYERAQNNHLKVCIEGVSKPMYTASTPSDRNAYKNFTSDVKRSVRLSKKEACSEAESSAVAHADVAANQDTAFQYHDKLLKGCVKSLRLQQEKLKDDEMKNVLESLSVDAINTYRSGVVESTLNHALKQRHNGIYIVGKEVKQLRAILRNQLDFLLPSPAYYADLLKEKDTDTEKVSKTSEELCVEKTQQTPVWDGAKQPESKPEKETAYEHDMDSVLELTTMTRMNRISLLRQLDNELAEELIRDIQKAMSLNREQAFNDVYQMMTDKNISLDELSNWVNAA